MSEWDRWIRRESVATASLDPWSANHLAVTLDRDPDLADGDPLPPAWHWIYFHDLVRASDLGPEGHPKVGIVMPPIPSLGGCGPVASLRFEAPLVLGSRVERVSTIRDIVAKEGRSGPLVFVEVEPRSEPGPLATSSRRSRSSTGTSGSRRDRRRLPEETAAAGTAPMEAEFSADHALDSRTLFRYSALTFNAHRIHYDADYCRDIEGYPGIVVHGPLIATLLLDLCVRNSRPLGRFTYRATSPLFAPAAFTTNGATSGAGTRLWAADQNGQIAMEAEASPA